MQILIIIGVCFLFLVGIIIFFNRIKAPACRDCPWLSDSMCLKFREVIENPESVPDYCDKQENEF